MTDSKWSTTCISGLVLTVLFGVGGMVFYSTSSYWSYHRELLKQGKVIVMIPNHYEVRDTRSDSK